MEEEIDTDDTGSTIDINDTANLREVTEEEDLGEFLRMEILYNEVRRDLGAMLDGLRRWWPNHEEYIQAIIPDVTWCLAAMFQFETYRDERARRRRERFVERSRQRQERRRIDGESNEQN